MIPTSALHAYIAALPTWFWLSNVLCVALVLSIRVLRPKSIGWLLIAMPILIIAIGNAVLFYQTTILFAGSLSPSEIVKLKVPTIVTTVLWGGIGVRLAGKWVTSLGGP